VSTTAVTLTSGTEDKETGSFTLTANGGPVMSYTITVPASANGLLTVSPATGVLGTGQSASITLTLARPDSFDQTLTIDPGGLTVTVTYTPPTQVGGPPASILQYRVSRPE
jgi:hypothetical protein